MSKLKFFKRTYIAAAGVSFLLSVYLWFNGSREEGLFFRHLGAVNPVTWRPDPGGAPMSDSTIFIFWRRCPHGLPGRDRGADNWHVRGKIARGRQVIQSFQQPFRMVYP
ncbi:MAG: hypothetical protein CM1200mP2_05480 [Planctomycetaceae bacterium]|nr:MAG: hypothetical protein CM1200mP2_05480 [Planctomycetaceae bacterium]